jgi:hypothetical protein
MRSDDEAPAEFTELGDELLHSHRARAVTFGFTLCALSLIFVLTFLFGSVAPHTLAPRLVLVYLAHAIVNVALLLTHRRTHQMEFTAGYLRTFVLPKMPMGRQEGRPPPARIDVAAMRSTRALGGLYALLVSAVVFVGIANGLYRSLWGIGLPVLALTGVISAQWLFLSEPASPPPDAGVESQDRLGS